MKREHNHPPPPYFPSKLSLPQLLISVHPFTKRDTDVPEITTFLPASDSLFGSRLIFQQSYLTWSQYSLIFNEMGAERHRIRIPRNTLCKQLMIGRRWCTILPSCICERCSNFKLQPSFLIQQHKGKRILC